MARHIEWDETEKRFVGTVDGLPDVVVYDTSWWGALRSLEVVIEDLRDLAKELGHDFPDIRRITRSE